MWISIQVLIVITVILATIFFVAEYQVQGEEYNYWSALVWAFTRYIEDPGEFSNIAPVTVAGRWMATLIGIVGILIFAVPSGLIGGAFISAIENNQREKHLKDVGERLKMAFRRKQEPKTMYRVVPRYISMGTLQAAREMTDRDIIEAVRYNPNYRLRNLATAETYGTHFQDQLAVEMFPKNTDYGCCINRGSDITIVCPTALSEAGVGNFTFYLALIGGFNYISKEVDSNIDAQTSYYLISDEKKNDQLESYLKDLRRLSKGENHWTIFIISSESRQEKGLYFITKTTSKTGRETTILDNEGFERIWSKVSTELEERIGVKADLNVLKPVGTKNVAVLIGGGETTNAFTIRIASSFLVWDPRYLALAKELAKEISMSLGESYVEKMTDEKELKKTGYGYFSVEETN